MAFPSPEPVAALFGRLADLAEPDRQVRLAELNRSDPPAATELRTLFGAEAAVGDFLAVLADGDLPHRPTAPASTPTLSSGQLIGPYRLLRRLGKGGTAVVWLAHDERLARPVALKIFSGTGLLSEARAAARLDHPNVAIVHDIGETPDSVTFMAMAYCDGGSLADRLTQGALPLDATLRMARELASALGAAHAHGITHRDVKPGNVLFDANGQARLADFGIAASSTTGADHAPQFLGTLAYMAPEQLAGRPVDHRADLWSLGVTLYQALTGTRPFDGRSRASLLYAIIAGQPDRIASHAAVPPELERLVLQLLEKDPDLRPRTAADLEHALARVRTSVQTRRQASAPPSLLSPLVGRVEQLDRAAALLERCRLVTLTGPGGTGKTRLAIEIARCREGRAVDGTYFVPLAAVASPELVPNAIAQVLGLQERGATDMADQVRQYCARAELFLVLDNCEHLPDAAPFIASLLAQAPRLRVLATSRAPLQVQGEQELPVPPLQLPDPASTAPAAVRDAEAVRLFVQRAAASDPDFRLTDDDAAAVAAICRRLDGLPLAIELAAARVKTLGPVALQARLETSTDWLRSELRDRPERHRTLQHTIGWSYALLGPAEQALFRALSVFVGGFWGDAPAAVLGRAQAPDSTDDTGDLLASLVDKSLIVTRRWSDGTPRFGMLETIRDYALQQLRAAGDETVVRRRHAAQHVAMAEAVAAQLRGPDQAAWHARLREDHHNLRTALALLVTTDDLSAAARMAVALHRYWLGLSNFLRDIMTQLTELDRRIRDTEAHDVGLVLHGDLLTLMGSLISVRGDHPTGPYAYHEAGLATYRRAGHAEGEAKALNHLGWSALVMGRYEEAAVSSAEALALHRRREDAVGIATSLINLGWVALSRANFAEAERQFDEALRIQRRLGDRRSVAYALGHLGTTAFHRGDTARAMAWYDETEIERAPLGDRVVTSTFGVRRAIVMHMALLPGCLVERIEADFLPPLREAGRGWSLGYALAVLGRVRLDAGDLHEARAALEESLAVRRTALILPGVAESEALLAELAMRAGSAREAATYFASSLRTRRDIGERLGELECCEGISAWLLERNAAEPALTLLTGTRVVRQQLGAAVLPRYQPIRDALQTQAEERLGRVAGESARARGTAMTLGELGALALSHLSP